MKKLLIIICSLLFATSVCAQNTTINGEEQAVHVLVNGEEIVFPDQQPVIINDRTLLPIRGVMEAMGKDVSWDDATNSAIITDGETTVVLGIGSNTMKHSIVDAANNETLTFDVPLDVAPMLINDRTCLPVRAVAEAFMATVDWEEETQTVMIMTADLLC